MVSSPYFCKSPLLLPAFLEVEMAFFRKNILCVVLVKKEIKKGIKQNYESLHSGDYCGVKKIDFCV